MSSIWTIRRSATDVKLTGLCGGVAQRWGIDPVLVRVGWALLALSGGIGLVLYVAGWLLIPVEGSDKALVDDLFGESVRRWPKELWITIVVVASIVMVMIFGSLSPFGIAPAIVIAVIWYFGFYKGRRGKPDRATTPPRDAETEPAAQPSDSQFGRHPGPPTAFAQAAEAWRRRIEEQTRQVAAGDRTAEMSSHDWPTTPAANLSTSTPDPEATEHTAFMAEPDPVGIYAEPRPPAPVKMSDTKSAKRLRLVALIVLGLVLSGLGVVQGVGIALPLAVYLAAALLVIGLTLIVATWFGLARGLLPVGVILAVAVLIVTAGGPQLRVPVETTSSYTYTTLAELPVAGDTEDFGRLSVDLSQLAVTGDTSYTAHVDLGELQVTAPQDANIVVNYTAGVGAVHAYGDEIQAGAELTGQVTDPQPAQPGQHTLTLNLSVDAGHIQVRR